MASTDTIVVYIDYILQGANSSDFMGAVVDHKIAKEQAYVISKHFIDLLNENRKLESVSFEFDGYQFTAVLNLYNVTKDEIKSVADKMNYKHFELTVETDHLGESTVEYALDRVIA